MSSVCSFHFTSFLTFFLACESEVALYFGPYSKVNICNSNYFNNIGNGDFTLSVWTNIFGSGGYPTSPTMLSNRANGVGDNGLRINIYNYSPSITLNGSYYSDSLYSNNVCNCPRINDNTVKK